MCYSELFAFQHLKKLRIKKTHSWCIVVDLFTVNSSELCLNLNLKFNCHIHIYAQCDIFELVLLNLNLNGKNVALSSTNGLVS